MYFGTKSYLKRNHYHTAKYAQCMWNRLLTFYSFIPKRRELIHHHPLLHCCLPLPYFSLWRPKYESLVTTIYARDDSLPLEDVFSVLLTFEARIQHHPQPAPISPALVSSCCFTTTICLCKLWPRKFLSNKWQGVSF
jgi:hypothetical protein